MSDLPPLPPLPEPAKWNKWNSHKFWMTVGAMLSADILCWFHRLDGNAWAAITPVLLGGFITGNIIAGRRDP